MGNSILCFVIVVSLVIVPVSVEAKTVSVPELPADVSCPLTPEPYLNDTRDTVKSCIGL